MVINILLLCWRTFLYFVSCITHSSQLTTGNTHSRQPIHSRLNKMEKRTAFRQASVRCVPKRRHRNDSLSNQRAFLVTPLLHQSTVLVSLSFHWLQTYRLTPIHLHKEYKSCMSYLSHPTNASLLIHITETNNANVNLIMKVCTLQ